MAILVVLPKYSMNSPSIKDVEGSGGVDTLVGDSNPIMSVQGASHKRPMGQTKAKRLVEKDS